MKLNEKIIITLSIIIICLIGFIIIRGVIQGRKNREVQGIINELKTGIDIAEKLNRDNIEEIIQLRKIQLRSITIIRKNGEIIRELTDEVCQLGKSNQDTIGIIDEIEKLFTEILGD